jgi:murein DD-endopeptidase MepM/ murein hydrolase activator NlpD
VIRSPGEEIIAGQTMQQTLNNHPKSNMRFAKTDFTERLLEANNIDQADFKCWAFCPGMIFGSTDKWWGDHGQRDFPHEGVDLCLYENFDGQLLRLDATTRIPVIAGGVVRAIFKDYLGRAVIVEHDDFPGGEGACLSVYAHTQTREELKPGVAVRAGDIIATIADTRRTKAKILPHLHLSLGRPSPDLVYEPFVWDIMRDPERVALLDPMHAIDGRWHELKTEKQVCLEL